jgi:hypothetical protein
VFASHGYKTLGCGKITHGYSPRIAYQEFGGTFGGSGKTLNGIRSSWLVAILRVFPCFFIAGVMRSNRRITAARGPHGF